MRLPISLLIALLAPAALAAPWYPVPVVADGKPINYSPLMAVSKPWRVCALLPQGQDKFWWGVSWGLSDEAERNHIKLGVYEAGGYANLDAQRRQFAHCRELKADAIIVSAVTATGLNDQIRDAIRDHVVVIDLLNGIADAKVTARAVSDTAELTKIAYHYMIKQRQTRPVSILWFPGPQNADWVAKAESGLRAVRNSNEANIIDGGYDVTEPSRQMALIRARLLQTQPDFVLANAVAAVAAARLAYRGTPGSTKIVAWYANEEVADYIKRGEILAAASSNPVLQARIALDLALRALEHKPHPYDVKVKPEMLDAQNIHAFHTDRLYATPGKWIVLRELPD